MKPRYFLFFLLFIAAAFNSCTDSFSPEVNKYNELMVVDGNVNDGPGPFIIKLSKSSKTKQRAEFIPYTKCVVQLEDNTGIKITLSEKYPGLYKTDSAAMQGIPGRSYKLSISSPDGEYYESLPEKLLTGVKIKSVYGELEHKTDPNLFFGRDGYQFYVDAETPSTRDNFVFWRMQCTYKFATDFGIICYYDHGVHTVIDRDTFRTCYRTLDVLDLFLLNTNELQQNDIKRVALNYEDNYTKALTIRYSLNVSQFTINEAAYKYWSTVKKMIDAGGDLYTTQPYQIENNLMNITHPDKPVLGYFMVAGLSEKRIFVNHPTIVNRTDVCKIGGTQRYPLMWFLNNPAIWPVFYADNNNTVYYLPQECVDCRVQGTQTRPNFWKD